MCPKIGLILPSFGVFAQAGPQYDGAGQGGPSADRVNHGGTCEIYKSKTFQPALAVEQAAPGPAAENRVDDGAEHDTVNQVAGKLGPFCHGPGNNGCGRGAKHHLKHPESQDPGITADFKIGQKETGGAEPAGRCATEHKSETDGPECQGSHGKIHQVFHHNIDGIFGPGKSGFHHGKTGLHEKNQGRGYQRPNIIGMGLYQIDQVFI